MNEGYHYPPELLNLLIDTIPLLCRSKNDVLMFFRGGGVSNNYLADLHTLVSTDRKSINKYEITRTILQRINEAGDSELRTRREVLKRVVEFESFSACWSTDQLKAKGLVCEIRDVVNIKDSFTKINTERKNEKNERAKKQRIKLQREQVKNKKLSQIRDNLCSLFGLDSQPQKRGKLLEKVLNDLFSAYEILIQEDFKRVDDNGAGIIEQVDGVIEFDASIFLVEMKWHKEPIGVDKMSQHLVRLFSREDAKGLFISSSRFAETTIAQCKEVLSKKTIVLCTLEEIVFLLDNKRDLVDFLRQKIRAVVVEKKPFKEIK
ncbi:Restriction endonuclease type IV Mrr domain-containing protein [Candidatus Electrothrix aarhusensis]